jgi:hypothetical protein
MGINPLGKWKAKADFQKEIEIQQYKAKAN